MYKNINKQNNKLKFLKKKSAKLGIILISSLLLMSVYSFVFVPLESFRQWNNPNFWINYPKSAAPAWTNLGFGQAKQFEHTIVDKQQALIKTNDIEGIFYVNQSFNFKTDADRFPSDFMFPFEVTYSETPPLIDINIKRPDNETINLYYSSLPSGREKENNTFSGRIFSTDREISINLQSLLDKMNYTGKNLSPSNIVFSKINEQNVLKGDYTVDINFIFFNKNYSIVDTQVIIGGTVFGLMGTDDLRRDLSIGILWGAPVALFIGLTVSISSIIIGLIYGIISGYKGRRTDEVMMRVNDIFYSIPSLPLLVILSITVGRSIFLLAAFLIVFSWVGMAKLSRSQTLQIKNMQYVEASRLMGQSDWKIITKHIIPQLLPFTFASIAIAVPGAILGEATLSFLGLGDPLIPTWGQILNEANSANAAARGLWWWIIPPGLFIFLTGLSFALLGRALESTTKIDDKNFR